MFSSQVKDKQRGGLKTQEGKRTIKPLPKNGLGPPHLWCVYLPHVFTPCLFFWGGNRHRPEKNPTFWDLHKWFWNGHTITRFTPQNGTIRYASPFISKQGYTPTPWAQGLRDQIQKWALQTQKTLYFLGFSQLGGGLPRPWGRRRSGDFQFTISQTSCLDSLRAQRLKKYQSRLKFSISLENFNLDWNFQSRPSEFLHKPQNIGVWWAARLKSSISLENFNLGGRSWIYSIFGPLGFFWVAEAQALEDGKGWGHKRGDLKMPFSAWKVPEKSLKIPWFLNQEIFRHFSWHHFHEKCTKNAWKMLEKCLKNPWFENQGVFQSPLLCPHPLPSSEGLPSPQQE